MVGLINWDEIVVFGMREFSSVQKYLWDQFKNIFGDLKYSLHPNATLICNHMLIWRSRIIDMGIMKKKRSGIGLGIPSSAATLINVRLWSFFEGSILAYFKIFFWKQTVGGASAMWSPSQPWGDHVSIYDHIAQWLVPDHHIWKLSVQLTENEDHQLHLW